MVFTLGFSHLQSKTSGISSAILSAAIVLLVATATLVTAKKRCTPLGTVLDLEEKVAGSDVVVYGHAINRTEDKRYPGKGIYIVDFKVRCIFRGGPFPEIIRVKQIGGEKESCEKSIFREGEPNIIYLNRKGKSLVPSFKENQGDNGYLDEIVSVCEITVTYPIGRSETDNDETCPEENLYEDECYALPTEETPTENEGLDTTTKDKDDHNVRMAEDDKEVAYQPVKSGDLTQNEEEISNQEGNANVFKPSTVISLCSLLASFVLFRLV